MDEVTAPRRIISEEDRGPSRVYSETREGMGILASWSTGVGYMGTDPVRNGWASLTALLGSHHRFVWNSCLQFL